MLVRPIISDSLGVRSMATYVETGDVKILLDGSAALGPRRYGLPPTSVEMEALAQAREEISEMAKTADIITISHYHYDHYDPDLEYYEGKTVLAKSLKNINKSQLERGSIFKAKFERRCELIHCDDSEQKFGGTEIKVSRPFPHGPEGTRLGFVIMFTIIEERRILFASDVQGPVSGEATDYIIESDPDLLIIDGPPTLFLGWKFSMENLRMANENMLRILEESGCEIILDHHLLRDLNYKKHLAEVYEKGGKRIKTFAEYLNRENIMLEAHRKDLWRRDAP